MKFLYLLPFVVLFSCANIKPKNSPKAYSQATQDEFSSIEQDRQKALERYRQMRWKNWDHYSGKKTISKKRRNSHTRKTPVKVYRPKVKKVKKPKTKPQRPVLAQNIIEEMNIEIRQNLSFFCMKNRKSSRFSNEADCSAYTQNILSNCKKSHWPPRDRGIVRCVKNRLR